MIQPKQLRTFRNRGSCTKMSLENSKIIKFPECELCTNRKFRKFWKFLEEIKWHRNSPVRSFGYDSTSFWGFWTVSRKREENAVAFATGKCRKTTQIGQRTETMPPSHKTITAAAMTTNRITSLRELSHCRISPPRGPFLERPGNLTGPESNFDIKVSRKVGRVLTSDAVHFVSLANNFTLYCTIFKPFETPSRMENKTA